MDTKHQLALFGLSLLVGILGGILYEFFAFLRLLFGCEEKKRKGIGGALDIGFWICFTCLSLFLAYSLKFPDFRIYFWLGYALGGILYLKSLHKIIAFLEKLCYNKITKLIKRSKNQEKTLSKEVEKGL